MAKTTQQTPESGLTGAPYAEGAASMGNAMVESMVQASQAYVDGLVAASQETVDFANRRLDTDVKACNRFADCRSYEDIAKVQQDWVATALQDYSQEWLKMAQVFAERMNGGGASSSVASKPAAKSKSTASAKPKGAAAKKA